jgi:hypothetical protein
MTGLLVRIAKILTDSLIKVSAQLRDIQDRGRREDR